MSSSLSKVRAVALSYGIVVHPTPPTYTEPAHHLGGRIIKHLWHNWGEDVDGLRNNEVDLYNVNIPLIEELLSDGSLKIYWTRMWRNSYGRLFKNISSAPPREPQIVNPAGPDAPTGAHVDVDGNAEEDETVGDLLFKWGPEMAGLISPHPSSLPVGSDGWAIHQGGASVTALRASFGEPHAPAVSDPDTVLWKMKL
jgi:broad specificity polyphosphatase/5'/3'-nucleotidase SurE